MTNMIIIGCGKDKKDKPTKAWDMYTSPYFTVKKNYAESNAPKQGVYSAEHGLLFPDDVIEPYNTKMGKDVTSDEAVEVARSVLEDVPEDVNTIEIIAGKDYTEPMKKIEDEFNYSIRYTLQEEVNGGMGFQMSWLSENTD